jgi:branched-chain amino acid transport system substrate-binding protein
VQVDALKLYVPEVEVMVRADFDANMAPINTPVKVAILHNTDPYEIARADALISDMPTPALAVNGKAITDPSNAPYYMRKQYDETDGAAQQTLADEMASAFQPHIIVLFGFSQGTTLLKLIEAQWPANVMRPRYVLPSPMARGDLTAAVGADDALRKRITGTIPGTWNSPPFENFLDDYEFKWVADAETYPGATLGAAGGYDAVFLLAYATATFGDKPVSGKDLADGLKKLSSPTGPVINASAKGVPPGFAALRDMGGIDYNGASGPLNFNPATGEAQSDIQVWCLASFNSQIIRSGLYYETAAKSMGGSVSSACQ